MKQLKQETGRSMVEMLGVLAVIGVLSVGGIAGYTIAMNKHRANSVAADLMKRAVIVSSQRQLGQNANMNGFGDQAGEYPINNDVDTDDTNKTFSMTVEDVPQEVCQNILALSEQWKNASIQANCEQDKNNMTFIFNDDLSGISGENTPPQEPKECSECNNECGVCDTLTGKCVPHDELCPEDKPYCGANGKCDSCVGLTSASGTKQGQCLSCEDLENNTHYAKGDCRRCSNWISSGNGYCRRCDFYNYIAYSSYEDVLKCPHRVYKTYYSGRNNWYCNPEYSLLNEDQTDCTKIKDCPEGEYWMAGNCYPCSYSEPWYALKEEEAKRCVGQIYLNGKNSYSWCGAQGAGVATYTNCYSCDTPVRYWNEQDEKCYLACPAGTVADATTRKCVVP